MPSSDPTRFPYQSSVNTFHMQNLTMSLPNYPGYVAHQLPNAVQPQQGPNGSMPVPQQQSQSQPPARELIFFDWVSHIFYKII